VACYTARRAAGTLAAWLSVRQAADARQRPTRRPARPGCHVRGRTQASAYYHAPARCLTTLPLARSSGATVAVCARAENPMPKSSALPCRRAHTAARAANPSGKRHSNHATRPNQPQTQSRWPITPFPACHSVACPYSIH
jgi:hypothetical protein